MPIKPAVLIYKNNLLPLSETFVQNQAEALQRFTPFYIGSRRVQGLQLPEMQTFAINQGGLLGLVWEASYKLWGLAPDFIQHLRKLNPVLIHAHFGPDGVMALPLARALGIPLAVTFHGYDATMQSKYVKASFWSHRVYLRRRQALQQNAQLFIAVSNYIETHLLEQGFSPDKTVVHHIGVDIETFQPDPNVLREPIVLFVGRLLEKKGCEYLIRAMAKVQARMPNVELVIIGDGPMKLDLEKLAAASLSRYRFLGSQPSQVVRSWMNRSLILGAPSITAATGESEGMPIVILEAQAMGLPVVSSIHSGIPDVVVHKETGFLARERDWNAIADYILRLLEDKTLWQQFSQKGQKRVRSLFNLRSQTKALENLYDAVLQKNCANVQ